MRALKSVHGTDPITANGAPKLAGAQQKNADAWVLAHRSAWLDKGLVSLHINGKTSVGLKFAKKFK